ncbi:MAG: tRNA 2-thiouridine(34) synthase MnmA [Thermoanaerobacteraceae bacterium]
MKNKKRVLVGMSGGVDSSVAAYLLKEQGYEVIGITLKLFGDKNCQIIDDNSERDFKASRDAKKVADLLGIEFKEINLENAFKNKVIDYFVEEYLQGRTPNPCIVCNKYIKFGELMKIAFDLEADYIATGHYANIEFDRILEKYVLKKALDLSKDQTYALYNLKQDQLANIIFPLGNYKKEEIRTIAKKLALPVASKPDSQEICFISDNNYGKYIEENTKGNILPGEFRDIKGKLLGYHKGIIYYTIGQRRGLGISADKPLYVVDINPEDNVVVVGYGEDVLDDELISYNNNLIFLDKLDSEMRIKAKIRYNAVEQDAVIKPYKNDGIIVKFDKPQRAITPGQSVVFYDKDIVIGGGVIDKIKK